MDKSNSFLSIEKKILNSSPNSAEIHYAIIQLVTYQARPKVIGSLLQHMDPAINERDIGRLFKEMHGYPSKRGSSVYSPTKLIGTWEKKFHASLYMALFNQFSRFYPSNKTYALIESYKEYLEITGNTPANAVLSFSSAYVLKQLIDMNDLTYIKCRKCKCNFVHQAMHPVTKSSCPSCELGHRNEIEERNLHKPGDDVDSKGTDPLVHQFEQSRKLKYG